jgi:acyl-CoA reductase-like NAD-dependent aldehyde dehydrogenase
MSRLSITKTYKLFIDGKFPRSESGRTSVVFPTGGRDDPEEATHVCRASRKDVRDAVVAARKAQEGWAAASAYLRGQILYRLAEMIEARRNEFEAILAFSERFTRVKGQHVVKPTKGAAGGKAAAPKSPTLSPAAEVSAAIDRLICFAGWSDKFAQVLGCNNPVTGPFYNFTVPEATGVVAVVAPEAPGLLGLVGLVAPVLCSGNAVVAVAGENYGAAIGACVLAEAVATSDLPAGVLNILTGSREELVPVIASHRDIDGAIAAGLGEELASTLRAGAAENLKRVTIVKDIASLIDEPGASSPRLIEPFVEFKTVWHPAAT